MILARWHPSQSTGATSTPSIPKLRVTDSKWGLTLPAVDGASFANMHGEWLVDDIRYSPSRNVIRRLRLLAEGGIIQLVQPYVDQPYVTGCPEPFTPAWADSVRAIAREAYRSLRGFLSMSAGEIDRIHWLLDHERWEAKSYSDKALARPWAEQAIEWTVWALREAGFGGPITNHATGSYMTHGRCAQTVHPALSMPHISGYLNDTNTYTPAEIEEEMAELAAEKQPFVYTHHAMNHPRLIDVARKAGAKATLLWN
jgi:hypothetical protein